MIGSLVVEIGAATRASANDNGDIPVRYKKIGYLIARGLLALSAGALAVIFEPKTALAAFYIGASAPIVLDKLAQGAIPTIPLTADEKEK